MIIVFSMVLVAVFIFSPLYSIFMKFSLINITLIMCSTRVPLAYTPVITTVALDISLEQSNAAPLC